ncbi:MAG TPA: sugar ABC transporter permease [Actinomycetota bacterium]|nr:sugar ABC transporter permease [Actinomycetota bacterium]
MASTAAEVRPAARVGSKIKIEPPPGATKKWVAFMFLLPALFFLGALVVYPTLDTIGQSFRDASGSFVGIDNYKELADTPRIVTAIKNTFIWVATAPAIITGLGLVFAILTERVRYQTAIKILVFMPMAISFLATGVIWRVMYDPDPAKGFVNATVGVAADAVNGPGLYPDAVVPPGAPLQESAGGVATRDSFTTGETALIGLTAIAEDDVPTTAVQAAGEAATDGFAVVVWRDFKPGGGTVGKIEEGELGLPGAEVQVLGPGGAAVATATTGPNGSVTFDASELGEGPFTVRVAESTFATGFEGVNWLGPDIVTPAIIAAFCWMWAGFAVVVIGAGLAALPRDVLEAARVDGANEWQTFRYVTMPLLAPVLGVVFVTMVINVLKIFDIVYVTAPGSSQDEANVIALEMFKTTFSSRDYGVGSAVAVLLFVLVIPVMYLNIRRFRREEN